MPGGNQSVYFQYYSNPDIRKPLEEIYLDMEAFTGEYVSRDGLFQPTDYYIISINVLPPLYYQGIFLKGILVSNGVDFLHSLFPDLSDYFISQAQTLQPAIPWSLQADASAIAYANPGREEWFKKRFPERADKLLIPITQSDMTNEKKFFPEENTDPSERDIDVLWIGRMDLQKNPDMMLKALNVYERKYGRSLKAVMVTGHTIPQDKAAQYGHMREALERCEPLWGTLHQPVEFIADNLPTSTLISYYRRAKTTVLCSLLEGKCRVIHEAAACDSAVICFQQFNQYMRGESGQAFPPGAGLYAPDFTAESLADTIHQVLNHLGEFAPRRQFLAQGYGRRSTFNTLLDTIPYYREYLPGFSAGEHFENRWLNEAFLDNYGMSLQDYCWNPAVLNRGCQGFSALPGFYRYFYDAYRTSVKKEMTQGLFYRSMPVLTS